MTDSKTQIGIIGSGAIGGFYGLMLARAGYQVHFLLRSEYSAVVANGLRVRSRVHGDLHLEHVQAYNSVEDMPRCDWLLVGAKATSNAELAPLMAAAARPDAKIVVLQNGLGVEDQLRPLLPPSVHLIGGLCWICAQRTDPGVIEHLALGHVDLGYHSGPAKSVEERREIVEAGADLFRHAGIKADSIADLTTARWQKLVWNVPFNGLSVLLDSGTEGLVNNTDSCELVRDLMQEVITGAAHCGHSLPAGLVDRLVALTKSLPDYLPSMYLDRAQRRPLELDAIFAAPLAAGLEAGCAMPKVEGLYQALAFLASRN